MRGEKIYQYEADITAMIDFGVELAAILDGKATIPPQGARFDVAFAGPATGRLSGRVSGVDYGRSGQSILRLARFTLKAIFNRTLARDAWRRCGLRLRRCAAGPEA